MRALSQVKITFGAKVAIKSIGRSLNEDAGQAQRNTSDGPQRSSPFAADIPEVSGATNLREHYVPIVVGGIKHTGAWVELYRMAKKAI